ncbi:MAG: STAS domain-containing protein [Terriglobales bacterium]
MPNDIFNSINGLEISVTHSQEGALVHLNGRVNIDSSPGLRDRLLAILQGERPEAVTVDLSEVPYIDLSGIATLIEALKVARNHETTLHLAGLQERLLHVLEVTGVLSLFEASGHASPPSASGVV